MNIRSQRATARSTRSDFLWNGASRAATVGMFVLILLAALSYAQPVVMPVILAIVFGVVLTPLLVEARRHGVPHWFTALLLVVGLLAALSYAVVLLAEPLSNWIQKAPEFGVLLRERLRFLDGPIAAFNSLRESIAGPAKAGEGAFTVDLYAMLVRPMLGVLTPAVGQMVVFFATLFFFLSGRENVRRRFLAFWGDRRTRLDAVHFLNDTEASLARYFATISAINLGLGFLVAVLAFLVGLPTPPVWGVLAFILNFMPYIGPAVMIVMLFGVGVMSFESLAHASAGPVLFLAASVIEGQFITPGIVGLRLALSPLLVFLAVAFWTWFWGPFGAVLAVPLLIIGMVALNHLFPRAAHLPD
jgi:predicted PurR-regulated permease PerM